jgi:RNA recognition motif-containing protein
MVKLFVSGFPLDINEIELAKLIAPYGDIATMKIVRDKKTRICKGYAFIEMETEEGAEQAIEALNGTYMKERELTVKISEEAPAAPQKPKYNIRSSSSYKPNQSSADRPKRPRK